MDKVSCCKTTKKDFIIEKAKNFRNYIAGFNPSDEVKKYLDKFDENLVIPTITTIVLPIVAAKAEKSLAIDLVNKLTVPTDQREEVVNKICRYLTMFNEILLS